MLRDIERYLERCAMDDAETLAEHDRKYHPDGYKEGDTCNRREKGDKADAEVGGQRGITPASSAEGIKENLAQLASLYTPENLAYGKEHTLEECEAKFGGDERVYAEVGNDFLDKYDGKVSGDATVTATPGYLVWHLANSAHTNLNERMLNKLSECIADPHVVKHSDFDAGKALMAERTGDVAHPDDLVRDTLSFMWSMPKTGSGKKRKDHTLIFRVGLEDGRLRLKTINNTHMRIEKVDPVNPDRPSNNRIVYQKEQIDPVRGLQDGEEATSDS